MTRHAGSELKDKRGTL